MLKELIDEDVQDVPSFLSVMTGNRITKNCLLMTSVRRRPCLILFGKESGVRYLGVGRDFERLRAIPKPPLCGYGHDIELQKQREVPSRDSLGRNPSVNDKALGSVVLKNVVNP